MTQTRRPTARESGAGGDLAGALTPLDPAGCALASAYAVRASFLNRPRAWRADAIARTLVMRRRTGNRSWRLPLPVYSDLQRRIGSCVARCRLCARRHNLSIGRFSIRKWGRFPNRISIWTLSPFSSRRFPSFFTESPEPHQILPAVQAACRSYLSLEALTARASALAMPPDLATRAP